jgi:hypothetical protein
MQASFLHVDSTRGNHLTCDVCYGAWHVILGFVIVLCINFWMDALAIVSFN